MIITYDKPVGVARITGIHGVYPIPEMHEMLARDGTHYIEFDILMDMHKINDRCYVLDGHLEDRPVIPALTVNVIKADGKEVIPIGGLPNPCVVKVDEAEYLIKGGQLDFAVDAPGTYKISIDQWPYLPWSAEVIAS